MRATWRMRSGKRSGVRWSRSTVRPPLRCAACSPPATCSSRTCPASVRRRSPSHRQGDRRPRLAHPVHRGPDLDRRDRPGDRVRQPRACAPTSSSRARCSRTPSCWTSSTARAAHAVGPARGDGGTRRHGRQAPARAAAAVLLHRHHEPARQRRHVRAGARLVRPLRDAHRHRLPVRERRARPAHPLQQRRPARGERSDRRSRRRRAVAEGHRAAAGRRGRARLSRPPAPLHPRASRTCSSAPRRAPCSRCTAAHRRPRCSTTPPRSPSSTCAASSSPASRTASASGRTPRRAPCARRSSSARPSRSPHRRRRSQRTTAPPARRARPLAA